MGSILTKRSASFAAMLALTYGLFGVIWIALSDTVVASLASDPKTLTVLQTWKGWAFVTASGLLIYVVGLRLLRAMEDTEHRYRMLFADSPEPLLLYDPATMAVVEMNAAAGRLFGYEPAEARGLPLVELMLAETRSALERALPRLTSGQQSGGVWRMRGKDGRPRDISSHGQMVVVNGRALRLVQMADVTARLRAEYELLRTMEGLATANARMRELGHALSHDVQEPLRQVGSFVQLLARRYGDQLDADANQYIEYAVEGIHRLKTLIGDVESFALGSAFIPSSVAAGKVVAEVLAGMSNAVEAADASVEVGALPRVLADPGKLSVIFHALLDNAIKFRRADRRLSIRVEGARRGDDWLFRVVDNGMGIEPQFRESVFSLFSRLHTRDRIPGNGTGLALARRLVEAHGGRIWAEDGEDGGVAICFTLAEQGAGAPAGDGVPAEAVGAQH